MKYTNSQWVAYGIDPHENGMQADTSCHQSDVWSNGNAVSSGFWDKDHGFMVGYHLKLDKMVIFHGDMT